MEDKTLDLIDLKAKARKEKGKSAVRSLRRQKKVPGIVYGPKMDPLMLSVEMPDLDKVVRENGYSGVFIKLSVEGDRKKARTVMLREVQTDTFAIDYFHVDFQEIDMDTELTVTVPVDTVGECKGVTEEGGFLQVIRREIDVICKPSDTPEVVEIDISGLVIGDSIHVEELDLGENVQIPFETNFTILTVVPPEVEEEEEEELEEGEEAEGEKAGEEEAEEESSE
jgi:large subunit ribosomal protein L25